MSYNTSVRTATNTSTIDRAIASLFVAGVMFVLGYTVVRAGLAGASKTVTIGQSTDVEVVVPGEGTLWAEFGTTGY